jgi:hypothetical protein
VFKILINETPFLIDDKAMAESLGKNQKDMFTIQIDSIRKSLGIESMDDVEMLVTTFYEYSDRHKKEQMIDNEGKDDISQNAKKD